MSVRPSTRSGLRCVPWYIHQPVYTIAVLATSDTYGCIVRGRRPLPGRHIHALDSLYCASRRTPLAVGRDMWLLSCYPNTSNWIATNHRSISIRFRDARVWCTDGQTDRQTTWTITIARLNVVVSQLRTWDQVKIPTYLDNFRGSMLICYYQKILLRKQQIYLFCSEPDARRRYGCW